MWLCDARWQLIFNSNPRLFSFFEDACVEFWLTIRLGPEKGKKQIASKNNIIKLHNICVCVYINTHTYNIYFEKYLHV